MPLLLVKAPVLLCASICITESKSTRQRSPLPTFEETVLARDDNDSPSQQAGSPVELAVVLVEPPIGAAHGQVAGPACLQALTGGLPSLMADHTSAPTATRLLPAGRQWPVPRKPCGTQMQSQTWAAGGAAGFLMGRSSSEPGPWNSGESLSPCLPRAGHWC